MTFPIDIHIGSFVIHSHALFEVLAFFIGYQYYKCLKRSGGIVPLSPISSWWIIVGAATGALIFSRFLAALENSYLFFNPPTFLYYIAGQTIVGGIVGGLIGVEITKKIIKLKRKTGDLFVYPLILGIIIGRIGCFLQGVTDGTVGLPCDLLWCIQQGDQFTRHPTALYEIIILIILWITIKQFQRKNVLKEGGLFQIFIFGYFSFRFLVEFIKPVEYVLIGLSPIQIVSFSMIVYSLIYFIQKKHYNA